MTSAIRPPTLDEIAAIAREAFDSLPDTFRNLARDVVLQVAEFPDADTESEMELQSPFDLLGLYQGVIGEQGGAGTRDDLPLPRPMPILVRPARTSPTSSATY